METTVVTQTSKEVSKIGKTLSATAGRVSFVLKKHSPEILMIGGIVGVIGSTILACRATLRAEEVIDRHEEKMERIKEAREQTSLEDYTEQDMKKDLTIVYVQTSVDYIKLYGPSASLLIFSICCLLGAHSIMRRRNVALMAAYKTVEEAFAAYRKRVVEEHGEQKDYMYRHGLREEEVVTTETGDDGKTKKVKTTKLVDDGLSNLSKYARRYNRQTSSQWMLNSEGESDHMYNMMFLQAQQNSFNDLLQARGHVFLNEVYDCLGLERSSEGQIVGWRKGEGDDCIDFGIDLHEQFVMQKTNDIILDFNVDGPIFDKI